MTSKTICAVPWMHLNFEPNGKVVPCCLTSAHNYFAGDLNKDSIEEIWINTPNRVFVARGGNSELTNLVLMNGYRFNPEVEYEFVSDMVIP